MHVQLYEGDSVRESTRHGFPRSALVLLAVVAATFYGCNRAQQKPTAPQAAEVQVGTPVVQEIRDFEEFPGHIEAVSNITIRARVSGYLEKVLFGVSGYSKGGFDVKQGDPLFEIDRRTYQADYDRAVANLALSKAHLTRLEADFERASSLLPSHAISQSDFDQTAGDRAEAAAAVKVAEAALHSSRLNLDFTIVHAPISGRISRQFIDPGNLVKADDTPLTTIVSLDPMYAYFDVDERTMLKIRRLIRSGKVKSAQQEEVKVYLGLSDEEGFPHEGKIDFIDNQVESTTGTLRLRGIFANSNRILSAGMFVRIRVPIGDPRQAILVSERALASDQGQKYLYLVSDKNEVIYRRVEVGGLHEGLRVIESGVSTGDRVILSGLQRVRPGVSVSPKSVAMTAIESLTPAQVTGTAGTAEKAATVGSPAKPSDPSSPATSPQSTVAPSPRETKEPAVPLVPTGNTQPIGKSVSVPPKPSSF